MTTKNIPLKSTDRPAKPKAAETKPARTAVKARSRKEPAPLPSEPTAIALSEEEIALRSYFLWESRGRPLGSPEEDWYKARNEMQSIRQLRQEGKRYGSRRNSEESPRR